jgi:hypothetical protein
VLIHEGSTLVVVGNALRLLNFERGKAPRHRPRRQAHRLSDSAGAGGGLPCAAMWPSRIARCRSLPARRSGWSPRVLV